MATKVPSNMQSAYQSGQPIYYTANKAGTQKTYNVQQPAPRANQPATGSRVQSMMAQSGVTSSPQSSYDPLAEYRAMFDEAKGSIEKATQNLINQANGDYDFAAKWIEAEFTKATGNNDEGRKQFLASVADDLEAKVGRIAYDYKTGTYRTEQDLGIATERLTGGRDLALARLNEDEAVLRKQLTQEAKLGRQVLGESLNERGVLSSSLDNAQGLAGNEVKTYDEQVNDRFSALSRAFERDTFDVNEKARQGLQDANIESERRLQDFRTVARRDTIDSTDDRNYRLEEERRLKERRIAEAEAEKSRSLGSLSRAIGGNV